MFRLDPKCGVCGRRAEFQMESVDTKLCVECAKATFHWLYRNQCYDNVIGFDLTMGLQDQEVTDRTGVKYYRVWIPSEGHTNSYTGVMVRFESKDCA